MSVCDVKTNGELRLAQQLVPDSQVVFDVGARNDDYLTQLNPDCQFHLFEPIPASFSALQERIAGRANIHANPVALGRETGQTQIFPDTESLTKRAHGTAAPITIEMIRLDDYCRQQSIDRIDFLKIDTEGYELEVLHGGAEIVQNGTAAVQFEYGGTYLDAGITLEMVFDFFGPDWYFYRVCPEHLRPIPRYTSRLEDYHYSNYVASRTELVVETNPLMRLWQRWNPLHQVA